MCLHNAPRQRFVSVPASDTWRYKLSRGSRAASQQIGHLRVRFDRRKLDDTVIRQTMNVERVLRDERIELGAGDLAGDNDHAAVARVFGARCDEHPALILRGKKFAMRYELHVDGARRLQVSQFDDVHLVILSEWGRRGKEGRGAA